MPKGKTHQLIDADAYLKAKPEERLRMLDAAWSESKRPRTRTFFEGRMLEITIDMDEHPDWFQHGCACASCCEYA